MPNKKQIRKKMIIDSEKGKKLSIANASLHKDQVK